MRDKKRREGPIYNKTRMRALCVPRRRRGEESTPTTKEKCTRTITTCRGFSAFRRSHRRPPTGARPPEVGDADRIPGEFPRRHLVSVAWIFDSRCGNDRCTLFFGELDVSGIHSSLALCTFALL